MSTRLGEEYGGAVRSGAAGVPISANFRTPWGEGAIYVANGRLVGVELPPCRRGEPPVDTEAGMSEDRDSLNRWISELTSYFRGEKLSWDVGEIGFHLESLASFARRAVEALMRVPHGATVSYGDLAELAGHPRAARAVGSVMATNPLPIVVPCHRVIRSDGSLGRYGTDATWKERLLSHERRSSAHG